MQPEAFLQLMIKFGLIGEENAVKAQKLLADQKKSVDDLAQDEINKSRQIVEQKKQELAVLAKLTEQREKDAAAGKSTDDLDNAIGRLNRSLHGSSHHFNSARLNSELFRISMMSLGAYMPGLETALYAALSAGEASFLGIMGALLAFENEMASLSDTAAIQQAAFKGDADAIAAVETATQKADIAARLFLEDLVQQNAAGATAADVAARIAGNYKNLITAQSELDNAQKSVGAASIEAREKRGVISHQEALEEKLKLDALYAQRKLQLDAWLNQQEERAKIQQLQTEQQQLKASLEDQKTDQAAARKAEQEKARHDARAQTAKDNLASAQKTLDELAKSHGAIIKGQINDENVQSLTGYYEKYIGNSKGVSLPDQFLKLQQAMMSPFNSAKWDTGLNLLMDRDIGNQNVAALAKYEGAKQQIEGAKKELAQLSKSQFDVDLNAQRAAKQLSATDDAVRNLQTSVNKLSNEIPKLVADHAAKVANDTTTANLNLTAEAVKNGLQPPANPFLMPPRAVTTTSWPGLPVETGTESSTSPSVERKARSDFGLLESYAQIIRGGGHLDDRQTEVLNNLVAALNGNLHATTGQLRRALDAVLSSNTQRDRILDGFEKALQQTNAQLQHLESRVATSTF
jgi:hypothetical protein